LGFVKPFYTPFSGLVNIIHILYLVANDIISNDICFLDSLFSLIILIYVAITFSYIFYAFCWRSPDPPKEEDKVNKMAAMSTCGHSLRYFFYAFCWRSTDSPKEEDKVNKMAAMSTSGHTLRYFLRLQCWRSTDPPKEQDKVNKWPP
jgi:hypothetical protein